MNNVFSERMVQEQPATEELCEKGKRPRVEHTEDDDVECISNMFLHREEVENKV